MWLLFGSLNKIENTFAVDVNQAFQISTSRIMENNSMKSFSFSSSYCPNFSTHFFPRYFGFKIILLIIIEVIINILSAVVYGKLFFHS